MRNAAVYSTLRKRKRNCISWEEDWINAHAHFLCFELSLSHIWFLRIELVSSRFCPHQMQYIDIGQTHIHNCSLFAAGENILFFPFMFSQNEKISADQSIFSRLHIFILFCGWMDKSIVDSLKFLRSSHSIYYIVYYLPVKCVYAVLLLSGNVYWTTQSTT